MTSLERPLSQPLKRWGAASEARGGRSNDLVFISKGEQGCSVPLCYAAEELDAWLVQISVYCQENLDLTVHLFSH